MKPIALSLLLALPVFTAFRGPAPGSALAPPPAAAAQDTVEFMKLFRQAMRVGATDEMNRLVRKQPEAAVFKIVEICEAISLGSSEKLESEIDALTKTWKRVFKSKFAEEMYTYFSLLRPEVRQHRNSLTARYRVQNKNFIEAERAKDPTKLGEIAMVMKGLGESFEEIGDYYYASQAYLHWGKANDESLLGQDADLKQAHDGLLKCVQMREKVDLKDAFYSQAFERQKSLEAAGFGAPLAKPAKPTEPAEGAALMLAPTYELYDKIGAVKRPLYSADSIYMSWSSIQLREKGSTTTFRSMGDRSPKIIRSGASKAMIDTNGDGEGDVNIPMTGKLVPVELELPTGKWAFLAAVGGDRDTFNGIQYNANASDTFMSIYIAPAASVVADVGGTPVRILDDNMDGLYGSKPIPWGHSGLVRLEANSQNFQYDFDSVVVGGSKVAVPWSEYLKVGDAWYRMQFSEDTQEIMATPMLDVRTGKLKLDLKGVSADYVIVRGAEKSRYRDAFFDVASVKGGIEVPVGRYELVAGRVSKGKKTQMAKALMVPSTNTKSFTVTEGKTTAVQLGAPFGFEFETSQDSQTLTVVGESIAVVGRGGESYQRMWNCVPRPEASIRPEGSKRGSKGEGMKGAGTQQELSDRGFQYAWFPFDLTLDKKGGEDYEAMLFEKKNKLFGKIESVWR